MCLRPVCLFLIGVLFTFAVQGQTQITYFETSGVKFRNPQIAGSMLGRTLVVDLSDSSGILGYLYDTTFQLVKIITLPPDVYGAAYGSMGNKIYFVWQDKRADSTLMSMLLVDSAGKMSQVNDSLPDSQTLKGYRRILPDRTGRFFLFYSVLTDQQHHLVVNGSLFDSAFRRIKTFRHYADYDPALERFTMPLVDTKGNMHFTIYDRLTNYHVSGHIRLHTLALDSSNLVMETFTFEKVKFYDLIFFDNPELQQVQLAGFYYDGNTRIKQGLASIRFPYRRNRGHEEKLSAFTQQQRQQIQAGMNWVKRKNDILDFMKLRDIIEEDGHVYITGWLLNVSVRQLVKDNEAEELSNLDYSQWIRPDPPGVYRQSYYVPMPESIRYPGSVIGVSNVSSVSTVQTGGTRALTTQPVTFTRPDPFYVGNSQLFSTTPVRTTQKRRLPFKSIFFHIGIDSGNNWQQVVTDSFPVLSASYGAGLWHYALTEKENLYFLSPASIVDNLKKPARLVSIGESKAQVATLPDGFQQPLFWSRPLKLADKRYLTIYRDLKKRNGLALIQLQ